MDTGIYVAVKIGRNSKACLQQITDQYTIPNMIGFSKLHATIVYSRTFDHIVPNPAKRFKGIITGYEIRRTRDEQNGLVVELDFNMKGSNPRLSGGQISSAAMSGHGSIV
ncbi:MAG: hypothetical protein ACREXW_09305 [Gammaproteobacteria bacterium]